MYYSIFNNVCIIIAIILYAIYRLLSVEFNFGRLIGDFAWNRQFFILTFLCAYATFEVFVLAFSAAGHGSVQVLQEERTESSGATYTMSMCQGSSLIKAQLGEANKAVVEVLEKTKNDECHKQ